MSEWIGAALLVVGVLVLCRVLGIVARSRAALAVVQDSLMIIGDRALDDQDKGRALQRNALRLFGWFLVLLVIGAAAFGVPLALVWVASQAGLLSWEGVLAVTLSAPFLIGTLVLTIVLIVIVSRRGRARADKVPAEGAFENRYSGLDQSLHYVAFATLPVQVAVSSLEDRWHRRRLERVRVERPVFITALPRAGTTLLLNLCSDLGEFVTHTYRRMPFVLSPLWWESYSRRFRVSDTPRERAHGDGVQVSLDSPEALEEMLWLAFWEEHYERDRIHTWDPAEQHEAFVRFFRRHMQKLAAIEVGDGASASSGTAVRRYLSKNNGNVARVGWLREQFPDARFVIPFRPPLQHAQSLLKQHRNFLAIHARDPFARHYMAAIGHFDFGENLRPIDFDGWLEGTSVRDPLELGYWLAYWTAGYNHLLETADDRICFVDFDRLSREPSKQLERLAGFLGVSQPDKLVAASSQIRTPRPHAADMTSVPQAILDAASDVHARLVGAARRGIREAAPPIGPVTDWAPPVPSLVRERTGKSPTTRS